MRRKPIVKSLLYALTASAVISTGHGFITHAYEFNQTASANSTVSTQDISALQNILGEQLTASNFISTISPVAQSIANNNNLYASTMVAQAALESAYGTSYLTQKANNLFGIKDFNGTGIALPTTEYGSNGPYQTTSNFKTYNSIMDSLQGYATFLSVNPRYANVFKSQASDGYQAARNVAADGYATDPSYANKLISIINTYSLTNLDNNGSTNTNNNNTSNNTQPQEQPKKELATASYVGGNKLESFQLSSQFASYRLYTHVKDTTDKNVTGTWPSHLKAGSSVYVDCYALRTYKGATSTWYRIKTNKDARTYWVSSKALSFPTINIKSYSGKAKLSHANRGLYSNVFNSKTLAKTVGSSNSYKNQTFDINQIATYYYHGKENTWYRINIGNLGDVWVNKAGVSYSEKQVAQKTTKKKTKKVAKKKVVKKTTKKKAKKVVKKVSQKPATYATASGHAYLNNYGKYALYNHIPGSAKHVAKKSWSEVKVPKNYKVTVNLKGIRTKYHTTWYRIVLNHKNYWIPAKALLFY